MKNREEKYCVWYVIISSLELLEAAFLLTATSAQQAELHALTRGCPLAEGKAVYFISLSLEIVTWLWCALETKDSWPPEEIILRMDIESMSNLNQSNLSLF